MTDAYTKHLPRRCDDLVVALTYRCNARCVMCNIWQSRETDAIRPEHLTRLPADVRTVNLSGGEPFLRDDLTECVQVVHRRCPRAQITISTNALLVDRVLAGMAEIRRIDPTVRLTVSLDGLGEAHDRVRGREGAFHAVVRVLDALQAQRYTGLRLSMTISAANADEFGPVADFAAERGLELGLVSAHACETHLGLSAVPPVAVTSQVRSDFTRVIAGWLRSPRPKQWLRAHFAAWVYRRLIGRPWPIRCEAGRAFAFIQADGTVYHCSVHGREMGNLTRQWWPEIWTGPAAAAARDQAGRCRRNCWMVCTARSVYRSHPWAVAGWLLAAKARAHLGVFRLPPAPADLSEPQRKHASAPH